MQRKHYIVLCLLLQFSCFWRTVGNKWGAHTVAVLFQNFNFSDCVQNKVKRSLWLTRKLESMVLISWAHLDKNVSWLAKQRINKLTHQSWQIVTLEFQTHSAIITVLIIPFRQYNEFFDAFQGKKLRLKTVTVCLFLRWIVRQFIWKSCFLDCLFTC